MLRKVTTTEDLLARALLQLLEEKPYQEISIKELVLTAQVSRSTFYRHFHDLNEVLELCYEYVMEDFGKELLRITGEFTNYDVAVAYFRFWYKRKRFISCLRENGLLYRFLEQYDKLMLQISQEYEHPETELRPEKYPRALVYSFYYAINGLWGIADRWIIDGCKETPEELASYIITFYTMTFYTEPACKQYAKDGTFPFPMPDYAPEVS